MNSKMSFCNRSLVKSDLKRFWWIAALHTVLLFFTFSLVVINYFSGYKDWGTLFSNCYAVFVFACIFPVVLGVMLFSYLNSSKSTCTMHSIPVLRKTHYISHYISGVILFVIPVVINSLILIAFMSSRPKLVGAADFREIFQIGGVGLLYSFVTFSAACAVSQICANGVASLIFTYGFGLLPFCAEIYTKYLLEENLFGYIANNNYSICAFLYRDPISLTELRWALMYLIIGLALAFAGYMLYRVRKAEKTNEVLAFDVLKPVFVIVIGIYAGALGYAYFDGMWEMDNMLIMIPTGLLGVTAAQMIVKKSLKPEGIFKNALIYTAICLVMVVVFQADITGYQNRVPRADDVEYVTFNPDAYTNHNEFRYTSDGKRVYVDKVIEGRLTDKKDIEDVVALHQRITKLRKAGGSEYVKIDYKLKNGKSLKREYNIAYEDYREYFNPVAEKPSVKELYFPILADDGRRIINIKLHNEGTMYEITDGADRLIEALKEDLKNVSADEYIAQYIDDPYIAVFFYLPCHYEDGTKYNYLSDTESYVIRPSYKRTNEVLGELRMKQTENVEYGR